MKYYHQLYLLLFLLAATTTFSFAQENTTLATSPYSQKISTAVPPLTSVGYENSFWLKDWQCNINAPELSDKLLEGMDTINIFAGKLAFDINGNPIVTGFGINPDLSDNREITSYTDLKNFIKKCKANGVTVKLSIGSTESVAFGLSWSCLTDNNIADFAKALVATCADMGADGIDFDEELEEKHPEVKDDDDAIAIRVGKLIETCRDLNPDLQISCCVYGDCNDNGPIHRINAILLENARSPQNGKLAIDRIYVMCYDYPTDPKYPHLTVEDNKKFLLSWEKWLNKQFGIQPYQLSIGIDPSDTNLYPKNSEMLEEWIHFAKQHHYSTAIFDDKQDPQGYAEDHWGKKIRDLYE